MLLKAQTFKLNVRAKLERVSEVVRTVQETSLAFAVCLMLAHLLVSSDRISLRALRVSVIRPV